MYGFFIMKTCFDNEDDDDASLIINNNEEKVLIMCRMDFSERRENPGWKRIETSPWKSLPAQLLRRLQVFNWCLPIEKMTRESTREIFQQMII
jgi:hypothetical protein